jgi:two-component system phosphate regulon sensor histidine kinase PhoR
MTRLNRFTGSLLARLALGYLLVTAVFAAAWLWSLYGPLTDAALHQQQRNLTAVAQSAALVASSSEVDAGLLSRQLVARTDLRLTLVDAAGDVIADSNSDASTMEDHSNRPEIAKALAGRTGVARRVSRTEGLEELYVAVPGSYRGQRIALRVAQPLSEIEEIAASSRRFGLGLLAFALVAAAGVSLAAARAAAAPVRELASVAGRMASGALTVRMPEMPSDLAPLAESLSELRSQVQARIAALDTERGTLRATLDGLGDAVLVLDGDVIRVANSQADRIFRAPAGGWEGARLEEAGIPDPVLAAIESCRGGCGTCAADTDPDPTGRAFRVVAAPLDDPSGLDRSIIAVTDITELARLDRMRRDFVANASHELKTPASGIRLLAQSAEAAAADGDTEQALLFTRQIETESERLQRLVKDLLDLSRLESTPAPGTIADVRTALERALVSHKGAATRKGLTIEEDLAAVHGGGVFVRMDPTDLVIALDNLLDNAIAYTETGSVTLRAETDSSHVVVAVSDTGPGIAAAHHERLFERFYRIDGARSRDSGGTGLGLALVKHVVERAGGTVTLDSAPGEGTTFTLSLPRAR